MITSLIGPVLLSPMPVIVPLRIERAGRSHAIRVRVDVRDRNTSYVVAHLLITPDQDEVLISDALAGALGLNLLDPAKGKWRFRDDPADLERSSMSEQTW